MRRYLHCLIISFLWLSTVNTALAADNPIVILETSKGDIVVELYPDKAPISVKNFLDYVDSGFYEGIIFHRVIKDFMIQTGGFDAKMNKKMPKAPIKNEGDNGLKNRKGTLAMARQADDIHSATSQFFINLKRNKNLDAARGRDGFAVFGKVIKGMKIVNKIAKTKTRTVKGYANVPKQPITIKRAYRQATEKQT